MAEYYISFTTLSYYYHVREIDSAYLNGEFVYTVIYSLVMLDTYASGLLIVSSSVNT